MRYKLEANITFDATSLDCALGDLIDHFKRTRGINVIGDLDFKGSIRLHPIDQDSYSEVRTAQKASVAQK